MKGRRELPAQFAERIVDWQRVHGRHGLPWQGRDPYRVWLSEVMLQQTQVATVLAYFDRFVARFPDVRALAAATQDEVLAQWSGLGYYGRARNLHRCAQVVVAEHGGEFPRSSDALAELPGIGRSTAAAIAAFCFGERVAILDGNVKRVLARVLAFAGDLAEGARRARALGGGDGAAARARHRELHARPDGSRRDDLPGARAALPALPRARRSARRREQGAQERYPVKTRRLVRGRRENVWLDLRWRGRVWLVQRERAGVWAGLWSWPEFESPAAFEHASLELAGPWARRCLPSPMC